MPNFQKEYDDAREEYNKVNEQYTAAIKGLQEIISEGQKEGKEENFKVMGAATVTLGNLRGLPKDLLGSDLEVCVEVEDHTYDASDKPQDVRSFKTAIARANATTVEWKGENNFTFDIMSGEAKAVVTVNRKSNDSSEAVGDLELDVRTKGKAVDGPQELRLKAIQLDDVPAASKELTPAEIARGVMERCKARAAEPTPAEIARGVMERCKVRAATDAAAEVARGVMERCKARAAADPVEIARGVMERCKARAAADAATPAEVARGVMERCKARAAADAAPAEPTSVAEEESADTTCTLNVKMEIELSPYMKKVRELDAIANRKRNLMMTMQQIKSEITAIAKAKRDKEAQVAIASAAAGKKGKKATAGKKKGPRKPAEPSRFDKVKQVFGADPAVRERNYYCAKNVGIFVGALVFISQCGEYMAV